MGRPPCCDKVGIKKGPWTPEEDIILVSYIQEHGPGNWRSVPISTGLMRCSKSCRLRWTNYLRPGIRRGNFTPHEEGIIVHLQSLLGNRWAAIASYLPQRTDNDIKNYWNTHLKKKLRKQQAIGAIFAPPPPPPPSSSADPAVVNPVAAAAGGHLNHHHQYHHQHDTIAAFSNPMVTAPVTQMMAIRRRSPFADAAADCSSSSYASSMDNISRLLNSFMKSSPPPLPPPPSQSAVTDVKPSIIVEVDPLLSFDHISGTDTSTGAELAFIDVHQQQQQPALIGGVSYDHETRPQQQAPLCSIEKWLLDEAAEQVADLMELSDGCCSLPLLY